MASETYVKTGKPQFDELYPRVKEFLSHDTMTMNIDGDVIKGYRSPDAPSVWIRDHSDMMRGHRFFEPDMKSAITHFADTQGRNGRIFDYVTNQPEKLPCERENWFKYVRVPVEADVEYRFVKAAFLAWQTTGDDAWVEGLLDSLEAALKYAFSHPWRWDEKHQLVKRAYTIDTWDFAYTAGQHEWLQFQIDDNTFWGILHGDNSGFYEACRMLAHLYRHFGNQERSWHWDTFADGLKKRMNEVCWNGQFYTHFVKLTDVTIEGVDEAAQLSFSNAMNINRGVTSHEQATSILQEYRKRGSGKETFAEWFTIEPPFPDGVFGDEKLVGGAYCNGGIMPLVGGELARAYFNHGFECFGVETLEKYYQLISDKNETYLWYFPDGTHSSKENSTSPDAMPTDGWGSSSMVYGFIEGLVGIEDTHKCFEKINLSPRWYSAGITEAEANVGYAVSDCGVGYRYQETSNGIQLEVSTGKTAAQVHLLIPEKAAVSQVRANGIDVDFSESSVRESRYVDFELNIQDGADVQVNFK